MYIISLGPAHPYRGGLASFNDRLARQFSSENHKIEIFTFRLQYPGFLFPGRTQYTDSPPPAGIKVVRILNSINPFNWIATGLKIKKAKPDILLLRHWIPFMGLSLGTVARIARTNGHTVSVCIFDNVIPHEKRPLDKLLTRYFTLSIDGAIVMARSVMEELASFRAGLPVKLNPHPLFDSYGSPVGREAALSALHLDSGYRYLLFFGFIRAYKGLDLLLKAFGDERLRKEKLKLIIAGEFYEDDTPYRTIIDSFNIGNDVIIHDHFIDDDEVALYFSVADLVVQPYKSATQSGVTQIAYYYEKPMLVTDVGGLGEVVSDRVSGYVVQSDPKVIADAILDFFANQRQNEFAEGVRRDKNKFSWDKMTTSIIEVYNECSAKEESKPK